MNDHAEHFRFWIYGKVIECDIEKNHRNGSVCRYPNSKAIAQSYLVTHIYMCKFSRKKKRKFRSFWMWNAKFFGPFLPTGWYYGAHGLRWLKKKTERFIHVSKAAHHFWTWNVCLSHILAIKCLLVGKRRKPRWSYGISPNTVLSLLSFHNLSLSSP